MSISVLNTDANLSAKTIVTAEGADTVTGLKTFDRDPSAPFAVSSGSAAVTNLNADMCAGLADTETISGTWTFTPGLKERGRTFAIGAWTTFTPTWTNLTVGNGTVTAKYTQIGMTTILSVFVIFGTTTTVGGNIQLTGLPTNNSNLGIGYRLGDLSMFDSSASAVYSGFMIAGGVTTANPVSSASPGAAVNATVPFTWATSDQLHVLLRYENT